jgi:hypothetical protein
MLKYLQLSGLFIKFICFLNSTIQISMHLQSLCRSVDHQIQGNKGKNLYYLNRDALFSFSHTNTLLSNKHELAKLLSDQSLLEAILDYTVSKVLQTFFHTNQYITVNDRDKYLLRKIYHKLITELSDPTVSLTELSSRHYNRLATWLSYTNPHIEKLNPVSEKSVNGVVCAEYSAALQLSLLDIHPDKLPEPILDIGCGEHAHLASFLHENHLNVLGIDRLLSKKENWLIEISWFDYKFKPESWGTIISNLSFSSHFLNNHLRADGLFIEYAQKYMEILKSLKKGGSFHYAPSLPFIEEHLDKKCYQVNRTTIDKDYQRTIITRL